MSYCSKCGNETVQGASFCMVCGSSLPDIQTLSKPSAVYESSQPLITAEPNVDGLGKTKPENRGPLRGRFLKATKWAVLTAQYLAVILIIYAIYSYYKKHHETKSLQQFTLMMQPHISQEKSLLPRMVDRSTRLDGCILLGNNLTNTYTIINMKRRDIEDLDWLKTILEAKLTSDLKNDPPPNKQLFIDANIIFINLYYDLNGEFVVAIRIQAKKVFH